MGLLKVLGIGKYLKKVKEYTDQQIANLVGSAPETLDTLQELSTALKDNANIVDTLNNAISKKADKTTVESLPVVKGDMPNSAVLKGGNNQVTNANEVALGNYNKSNDDTLFSIGIGTSSERKNAFEVKQNGDIYIEGLSGDILNYIKSLESRIKELEDIIKDITITEK
jgi:hypothetical protein